MSAKLKKKSGTEPGRLPLLEMTTEAAFDFKAFNL